MATRKAPQTHASLSATGISALLLGIGCGAAMASTTESLTHCPEIEPHSTLSLHEILPDDATTATTIRTVDSSSAVTAPAVANSSADDSLTEVDESRDSDESTTTAPVSRITTRLPGVPDSDVPRFRRQMFRTDI